MLAHRAVFLGPNRNITLITIGSSVTSYTYLLSWLLQSPDSLLSMSVQLTCTNLICQSHGSNSKHFGRMGQKGDLRDFENGMVVGVKWAVQIIFRNC